MSGDGGAAERWHRLERLFALACEREGAERAAFVARECDGDIALRDELLSLLDAHDVAGGPLDRAPRAGIDALPDDEAPANAAAIGPWRIVRPIGSGGAGEVFLAERADGEFDQRVAIKILRRDAAAELERFHAERRILARLEHPAIARLLDGGRLPDGRPYAVMEFVDGRPLIEHCRERGADPRARLDLFLQVCDAVAHAHRGLVVHRDLKPANILVTADGQVKLLDFGIAKLLDGAPGASEATQAPLTLDYAAPEQLTGEPITTATDVYALGVILFELLTGDRPWRTHGLPVARALKLLVEAPSPLPSRVARERGDPSVPADALEGDLDAILTKCLRQEPRARYDSVGALRADIGRHLAHEPVAARGDARGYVLQRFLRRHWRAATGIGLVALSLVVALATTMWQVQRVALERDVARGVAAREEAIRYSITNLFRASIEDRTEPTMTAKAMLDRSAQRVLEEYRDDPRLRGKVVETLADLYGALGDVQSQVPLLEGFLAQSGGDADPASIANARQKLANIELLRGNASRAEQLLAESGAFWQSAPDRYREQRLEEMFVRAALLRSKGDLDASIALYQRAIADRIAFSGRAHRETANLFNSLAITQTAAGRLDDALGSYREALDIHARLGRSEDLDALVMLANTGTLALRTGRLREAQDILRSAYTRQRAVAGDSAAVAAAMGLYGTALDAQGRATEAVDVLRDAVAMAEKFSGLASPLTIQNRLFLAEALEARGDAGDARRMLVETRSRIETQFGPQHLLALRAQLTDARLLLFTGRVAQALPMLEAIAPEFERRGTPALLQLSQALVSQGEALLALGRPADARLPLERAVELRERQHWAGSWELAQARLLLGLAIGANEPRGRALIEGSVSALREQLGDAHPLTLRAQQAL